MEGINPHIREISASSERPFSRQPLLLYELMLLARVRLGMQLHALLQYIVMQCADDVLQNAIENRVESSWNTFWLLTEQGRGNCTKTSGKIGELVLQISAGATVLISALYDSCK